MKTFIYRTIIIVLFVFTFSGCVANASAKKEAAFNRIIRLNDMNTNIRFWKPESSTIFRVGEKVDLTLENLSPNNIIFPRDYGIRIFNYNDEKGTWIEIANGARYIPPTGHRQISPKGPGSPGVIAVGLAPTLENKGEQVDIRVVVVGNIERDNILTDEQVGAYIDLILQP